MSDSLAPHVVSALKICTVQSPPNDEHQNCCCCIGTRVTFGAAAPFGVLVSSLLVPGPLLLLLLLK